MKRLNHFSRVLPATLALTAFSCAVSVTLLTAGCGGGGSDSSSEAAATRKNGSVSMTIKWPRAENTRKIPLATRSITVTVTGAGATQTRTVARPGDGSPSTVTFSNLPIRGEYILAGTAFASADGTGVALARASVPITFTLAEPTKSATLNLDTTIVRLDISPKPVSLSIEGPSRTLVLTAAGFDAETGGNLVPVASVIFSVANQSIASLSTNPDTGVVTITGLTEGRTTLTAVDPETNKSVTVDVEVGRRATEIWSNFLDGEVQSTATVSAAGNVYIGGAEGRLYAFTPVGGVLAPFPVDLSPLPAPVSQPLFLSPTAVYAEDNAGNGFVFNPASGAVVTSIASEGYAVAPVFPEGRVLNRPVLAPGGIIYSGTDIGTLSKATPTGTTFTVAQIPVTAGHVVNTPSVNPTTGAVFVTSSDLASPSAQFHAFAANNTRPYPLVELDGTVAVGTALSLNGNRVYAATADNSLGTVKVYGINAANGAITWERTLPNALLASGAPVVGPDGTVYIGTWGGRDDSGSVGGQVFALDGDSGAIRPGWPFVVPFDTSDFSDIDSSVAVGSDGTIYAGSVNGKLYALRSNGTAIWDVLVSDTGEAIIATPGIGPDGTVYVGARDGTFSAFR
ncbi:MAG: PQQ-like beta-propeller repeat protein [Akkermansiaceae bacterium]|nr:PQQ-like beta-propeller repeat protein [Armatimonadota bacterium]